MSEQYQVSVSPHITSPESIPRIMWTVNITLIPAGIASVYFFGIPALFVIISSLAGAALSEYLWQIVFKKPSTISDGSAVLTGLLLAYNIPPGVPLWLPFVGSAFSIIIAKMIFGGLGCNVFNPALVGRAFLLASWPQLMTTWWKASMNPLALDGVTTATPLGILKEEGWGKLIEAFGTKAALYSSLWWGNRAGSLGETCTVLLLLGGIYLIFRGYINWQLPLSYIATVGIFAWVFGPNGAFTGDPVFHIMAGGLIIGAFYMATDMVTIPLTLPGRIIFGVGAGIITILIRLKGGYPEGVCYSILLMNAVTPYIDRKLKPKKYGFAETKR
ncbi:MAG: RnfABCDGE type electron transport complex subunit D [Firmicutes bacterium]|nr:RnfABCDGE type electron transport complex subunit D [Bacillota bacterium]